jgi:hypothetical protein
VEACLPAGMGAIVQEVNVAPTSSLAVPFATAMRNRQLAWALAGGVPIDALEERHGKVPWVLKFECRERNLFRSEWWKYIAGKRVALLNTTIL